MTTPFRPTVADPLVLKGKRQLSMLRVVTFEEAAADAASVEMVSSTGQIADHSRPAATIRLRKACVRSPCGALKICSGGPSS